MGRTMIRQAISQVEKYIDNRSAEKEWVMASKGYMPMTPSILKEFEVEVENVFHTTDMKGLENLKKIQGTDKTISAFTIGSEGLTQGARTLTEVLVHLDGKTSFRADNDFYSALSRNGHKWLRPLMTERGQVVNKYFSIPMFEKMVDYFKLKGRVEIQATVEKLNGKDKAKFIKWYMGESKKIIDKKLLNLIRNSISKKKNDVFSNDELFLHNFKITSVDVVKENYADLDELEFEKSIRERIKCVKDMGLKFGNLIFSEDIKNII